MCVGVLNIWYLFLKCRNIVIKGDNGSNLTVSKEMWWTENQTDAGIASFCRAWVAAGHHCFFVYFWTGEVFDNFGLKYVERWATIPSYTHIKVNVIFQKRYLDRSLYLLWWKTLAGCRLHVSSIPLHLMNPLHKLHSRCRPFDAYAVNFHNCNLPIK